MGDRSYLPYDLAFERAGDGFRVEASHGGEVAASARVALSGELTGAPAKSPEELGGRLFRAVFQGDLLEHFNECRRQRRREDLGIRLRLDLTAAPELAPLPWEWLFDPDLGELLARSGDLRLVRFVRRRKPRAPLAAEPPLRLLVVIPEPEDRPVPGAAGLFESLGEALDEAVRSGRLVVERLAPATQPALERALDEEPVHLLQFVGHGDFRQRARYGKLVFEGRAGASRPVSAELVGRLLAGHESLRLAGLSAVTAREAAVAGDPFLGTALDLVEAGVPASLSLPLIGDGGELVSSALGSLYDALAAGAPADEAVQAAARRLATGAPAPALSTSAADCRLFAAAAGEAAAPEPAPARPRRAAPVAEPPPPPPEKSPVERLLEDKIARGAFDVFLSYSRSDGRAVKEIGRRLKERGVLPWLDEWELRPGTSWQRLLEEQIERIQAAAVFVGEEGIGPWQRREMEAFLNEFVERRCPVIPVLLASAPKRPRLPIFLKGLTWVDFRRSDPDPLEQLIWGVTGKKAGSG